VHACCGVIKSSRSRVADIESAATSVILTVVFVCGKRSVIEQRIKEDSHGEKDATDKFGHVTNTIFKDKRVY
jgi:hypothetical protein